MPGIIKSTDESRTSTTTVTDDSELTASLSAQGLYEIELTVIQSNSTTATVPNWRHAVAFTGSLIFATGMILRGDRMASGFGDGTIQLQSLSLNRGRIINASENTTITTNAGRNIFTVRLTLKVGDTGGTFSLQWAQGTSSANASTVHAGSSLYYEELTNVPS